MAKQHERSFAEVIQSHREPSHLVTEVPRNPVTEVPKSPVSGEPGKAKAKSTNKDYVKLTAYVPKQLHRAAKARLVEQGREISDLIEELVTGWLER